MTPTLGFAFFLWTVGVVLVFTGARAIVRQRREAAQRAEAAAKRAAAPDADEGTR